MIFGKTGSNIECSSMFLSSKVVVLRYIFLTRYFSRQREIICQSCVPEKLMYEFTQTGTIVLVLHLLGLDFLMFKVFHCFSIINMPLSVIVTHFRGLQLPHNFSEISQQHPSQFISILSISIFQFFDINEIKCYLYCTLLFMVIYLFFCVPT